MAQIIMWLLRKVASIAVETVVLDFVTGRARRRALLAPAKEEPVAELGAGDVDPGILLIAERIAAVLEEHGYQVTNDAAEHGEIVDAVILAEEEEGLAA